ncbi:hypothetical protein YC2023_114613 [Brassica napus]
MVELSGGATLVERGAAAPDKTKYLSKSLHHLVLPSLKFSSCPHQTFAQASHLTISGTSVVSGISFDVSGISELIVSKRAFKRMSNLRFLAIYKSVDDGNDGMHLPVEMEFPRRLRLLQWTSYPNKCLPSTFHPENLVNLCMRYIKLEL